MTNAIERSHSVELCEKDHDQLICQLYHIVHIIVMARNDHLGSRGLGSEGIGRSQRDVHLSDCSLCVEALFQIGIVPPPPLPPKVLLRGRGD